MSICVTSWFLHCPSLGPPTPDRLLGAILTIQFLFLRFYLFIFRQRGGREKEKERNINVWLPLTRPLLGTWSTTQASWLGIQLATLWFAGWCSIHWATPARAQFVLYFHISGSILLACLFCCLGSTYRWDHMVFVFHQLAYFTQHNALFF